MVILALALAGVGFWGIARLPTAFIPNDDQGYAIIAAILPEGASIERTTATLDKADRESPGPRPASIM